MPENNKLEMFNDTCIMFAIYHMFLFTNFNLSGDKDFVDDEVQFFLGYTFVGLVGFAVTVNIIIFVRNGIAQYKSN